MAEDLPDPLTDTTPEPEEGRWRRYESAMRARLEAATAAAEERRSRSALFDAAFLIRDRNHVLPTSLLVGAMASRIVIFLVPLFALVIFGFGLYGPGEAGDVATSAGMPALVAVAAGDSASLGQGFQLAAFAATIWATLYAANSLGRLIRRTNSIVWAVPHPKLKRQWMLPLIVIVLSLFAWFLTETSAAVDEWTFELVVGVFVAEGLGLMAFWVVVSRALPHDPGASKWTDFLPGALFVALGVVGLRLAMVVYFAPELAQLSDRYGSIAIALIMLTWAYWLGMIVVGSAEINAALYQSRRIRREREQS